MDNTGFSAVLSKAKMLRITGYYKDGLSCLSELLSNRSLSHQQRRLVALEKAENHFVRGYMKRAEIILSHAIKMCLPVGDNVVEGLTHTLLVARKALVTIFSLGKFRNAIRVQNHIRNTFLHRKYDRELPVDPMVLSSLWFTRSC